MPKVSVIIPVYNVEKFLQRCLDSVVSQTLSDIEIICVDDGSTDNSASVLADFAKKDQRIKVINQKNQGVSVARNNGIKQANGEYIGFVDSDDYIEPDFYEKLYQEAKKENADVALTSIQYEKKEKSYILLEHEKKKIATTTSDIFRLFNLPHTTYIWNKIYRKDFLEKNNISFNEQFHYGEDIIYVTEVASLCHKAVYVPETRYHYIYRENSLVAIREEKPEYKQNRFEAYQFYDKCIRKKKIKVPYKYQYERKVRIFGLPVIKIREIENILKVYYVFGLPVVKVKSTKLF